MELNGVVFPRPRSSYTLESMEGKILFVPKFDIYLQRTRSDRLNSSESVMTPANKLQKSFNEENNHHLKRTPIFSHKKFSASNDIQEDKSFLTPISHSTLILAKKNFQENSPPDGFTLNTIQEESSNIRASQPYCFIPKNGAPSMKGKMVTRMSTRMRDSTSLTTEGIKKLKLMESNLNNPYFELS